MAQIDLRALANTPGAGKARDVLIKSGLWDDSRHDDDGKLRMFTVEVSGTYVPEVETRTFKVVARSSDDAEREAEGRADFDEIEDTEVTKVEEMEE